MLTLLSLLSPALFLSIGIGFSRRFARFRLYPPRDIRSLALAHKGLVHCKHPFRIFTRHYIAVIAPNSAYNDVLPLFCRGYDFTLRSDPPYTRESSFYMYARESWKYFERIPFVAYRPGGIKLLTIVCFCEKTDSRKIGVFIQSKFPRADSRGK